MVVVSVLACRSRSAQGGPLLRGESSLPLLDKSAYDTADAGGSAAASTWRAPLWLCLVQPPCHGATSRL